MSMLFGIEPKPTLKNPSSLIRLAGIICGVGFAVSISAVGFYNNKDEKSDLSKWIIGSLASCL